jgi:archaellum component FlaF (FlaF/FlaG flagellin family)
MADLHNMNFRVVDRKADEANGIVELTVDVVKSDFTATVTENGKTVNQREVMNEWSVILNAFAMTSYAKIGTKASGFAYTFGKLIFGD